MKKSILFLCTAMLMGFMAISQNVVNLVVFSEDGDTFYIFINGIKQNAKPESNVKVTGVSPNVSLRIEFENKAYPQLKQNMSLMAGYEHTFRIKKDTKLQMKLRYFGQVPLAEASTGVATVQYHTADQSDDNGNGTDGNVNMNTNTNVNTNTMGMNTNVNTTTVSTTTTTKSNDDVSINMNVGGMGINMNVNGMGMNTNTNANGMNTTTSTTVTSTSSSSGNMNHNQNDNHNTNTTMNNSAPAPKAGCSVAMSQVSFDKMKASVEAKPFSDTKMSTAKIATKNACISVNQVREICKLFSMDDDKLQYAKYAYAYCINKSEYYQVSEIFSFSTTTDEFNKFLEQQ
ncbi:MAG: DUF4476 domain-containing protein [Bacteroidota bacterium]